MERPPAKANKATWIKYADHVEQGLADSQAALGSAQAAAIPDDPALVRQLRRRVQELLRSR